MQKLKKYRQNITLKWFLENAISFSSSTLFVYILSAALVPYLYTTLGNNTYGIMNFARSTAVNLMMFAGAGLGFAGIKEWQEDNTSHNTRVFWNIFLAKILLTVFSIIAMMTVYVLGKLLFNIPVWDKIILYKRLIFIFICWTIIENFISQWPFTASKNMRYMIVVNLIFKTFYAITAFKFIQTPQDVDTLAILLTMSSLGIFISTHIILIRKGIVYLPRLHIFDINYAFGIIKNYYYLMLQKIGASMFLDLPIIFVGTYASHRTLGLFSLARKFFDVMQSILKVLSKSIFVILDNAYKKAKSSYKLILEKLKLLYIGISSIVGIFLILLYIILRFIINAGIPIKQLDLNALNFIGLLVLLFYIAWILAQIVDIMGMQSLLVKNRPKEYGLGWFFNSLLNLPIIFILSKYLYAIGATLSIIITYLTLIIFFYKIQKDLKETEK